MKNTYISLYLPEFTKKGKKEKYLSIAFGQGEESLYKKLKAISTSEIKEIINIHNYNSLLSLAKAAYLKPTLYVKQLLNQHLNSNKKQSAIVSSSNKYDKWIKLIEKDHPGSRKYLSLLNYLKTERREKSS